MYMDFSSDYGPQKKQAKKRYWFYFKIAHTCIRTRPEDQFLYANFSAPPYFWLVPPHFVCSGDGTGMLFTVYTLQNIALQ